MSTNQFRVLDALPLHDPNPRATSQDSIVLAGGALARPRTVLPSDLAVLPWIPLDEDFRCLEGWVVPGLRWYGVRLITALEAYDAAPAGRSIEVRAGGYHVTLQPGEAERALLALWLDDLPLAADHGGPVRLVVAGHVCSSSVKWVDRITVLV